MPGRPTLLALAGVNGAGKSSVLGAALQERGFDWFNPDQMSRQLVEATGCTKEAADRQAWHYGRSQLEAAIAQRASFAFETTLGGTTIARLIDQSTKTHDVTLLYCGLDTIERHIARVELRTRHGGHAIPEERIRQRFSLAPANLRALLPKLKSLQVYDNSREVAAGHPIPQPVLVMDMADGRLLYPKGNDIEALTRTPHWAKPLLEAALQLDAALQAELRPKS